MISWKDYDESLVRNLHRFINDIDSWDSESLDFLIKDIQKANEEYNIDSEEYFLYGFSGSSAQHKSSYVSSKEYKQTLENSVNKEYLETYKNKYNCYCYFKDYFKRDAVKVTDFSDYPTFAQFVSKHKKYIIKVIDGSLGSKVSVVNVGENNSVKDLFFHALGYDGCIVEEYVVQDKVFSAFNPSSVNTIRLTTCCDNGEVQFLFSLARFGRDGAIVDNGGQGGIISMVDPKKGIIVSHGYTENIEKFEVHPNSKIAIKGFQIPRWDELIEMATELAKKAKGITVIGWDFALTDKGWAIIEANTFPSIFPIQMLTTQQYGHGMRDEYEALIGKYKSTVRTEY